MTQTPSAKPQKKRDPRLTMLLDGLKRIFIHNWPTKLLALLLAIILWGGLITQDPTLTRESTFPVSACLFQAKNPSSATASLSPAI